MKDLGVIRKFAFDLGKVGLIVKIDCKDRCLNKKVSNLSTLNSKHLYFHRAVACEVLSDKVKSMDLAIRL